MKPPTTGPYGTRCLRIARLTLPAILPLVGACADVFGWQEGKPYPPDAATTADADASRSEATDGEHETDAANPNATPDAEVDGHDAEKADAPEDSADARTDGAGTVDAPLDVAPNCVDSSGCPMNMYCANRNCVPRKPNGSVCAAIDECTSSICGGRCCATPCTCPQPSAGNLFKNPGFERDLSGWMTFNESQWNSEDADGCPYSGSAQVRFSQGPSQCVTVQPGVAYNFGGWFKNSDGNLYSCHLAAYADSNCTQTGDSSAFMGAVLQGDERVWTYKLVEVLVPSSAVSLGFACDANPNTFIDKLFFTPKPGDY